MATEINAITKSISPVAPLMKTSEVINIPADEDAFVAAYEANNDDLVNLAEDLEVLRTQLNTSIGQINTANSETESNALIASAVGNYQGVWSNATTYSKSMGVSVGGLYYISKADNNLNHAVTDTNYWTPSPANTKLEKDFSTFTEKATPADTDNIPLWDGANKKLSWANLKATLKTYFDTLYVALSGNQTIGGTKTFTSNPIAPTPSIGDNSTKVATTAYVKTEIPNALNATGTAPIYAYRAWVNFNGTGTVAIRASGNASSITDNGVGDYAFNFITAMPDSNYGLAGSCRTVIADGRVVGLHNSVPPSTSSVRIQIDKAIGGLLDSDYVSVSLIR